MKTYKYMELLAILNCFMDKSGIRWYCQNVCGGRCCKGHKPVRGRPCNTWLPCVCYLCTNFTYISDSTKFSTKLWKIQSEVVHIIQRWFMEKYKDQEKCPNCYFEDNPVSDVQHLTFDIEVSLTDDDIKEAQQLVLKKVTREVDHYKNSAADLRAEIRNSKRQLLSIDKRVRSARNMIKTFKKHIGA